MDKPGKLNSLLSLPAVYRWFSALVLGDACHIYISDYLKPVAGEKVSRDRGGFVRRREDYAGLAAAFFSKLEAFVRRDLLRIPYTHVIMRGHKDA